MTTRPENSAKHVFRFRRFSMTDSRCPMKIGTDGVLLGAWADAGDARNVLDVGTGCGVIALMLAQRFPQATIVGMDTHPGAVQDAAENFRNSPFGHRLQAVQEDFLVNGPDRRYDFIVSNPPFFSEDTLPPDAARAAARHAAHFPLEALAERIDRMLCERGRTALIYPFSAAERVIDAFTRYGFGLLRRTDVKASEKHPAKRSLLAFSRPPAPGGAMRDTLCLCDTAGRRSKEYLDLTKDFHLFPSQSRP